MPVTQRSKSLRSRDSQLSDTFMQLKVLNGQEISNTQFLAFHKKIEAFGFETLQPTDIEIFQVNVGKLCNQSCAHCHVDAGPDRKDELMTKNNLERCLEIIAATPSIHTVDITGGAPEMNPHFRWFVEACRKLGKKVMNRCNLTIIRANPKYHDLPDFFKDHQVHIVSSLPYFSKSRTDSQRGNGVFEASIEALKMLNAVGYGKDDSSLILDLVYNPSGSFLPAAQGILEAEFKRQLKSRYNIEFNNLFTITNMPISRFLEYLLETGNYEEYMQKLVDAFNPATIMGLMCRNTLSISWEGYIYDCDFNQMLDLRVDVPHSNHISNFDAATLNNRAIILDQHCYGCTAGAGSSCGGAIE